MQRNWRQLAAAIAILLGAAEWTPAAIVLWWESFETDGNGTRYVADSEFWRTPNDHFARTDGSNISNTTAPYSGYDGNWFWACEDTDDTGAPGANGLKNQYITWAPISVAGYTDLVFTGLFAVGNEIGSYDAGDYAWLAYSVDDGESWVKAMQFNAITDNGRFNQPFARNPDFAAFTNPHDPTQDNNGTASGHAGGSGVGDPLNTVFRPYSVGLPDADSLMIMVNVSFDADGEEFAFDALRITGTVVPEPSTAITLLTAVGGLALRRRRRQA